MTVVGGNRRSFGVQMHTGPHDRSASADPSLPSATETPVRARGVTGFQDPSDGDVYVLLPGGVHLQTVTEGEPMPGADVLRIVENLDLGPWPDTSWTGSR